VVLLGGGVGGRKRPDLVRGGLVQVDPPKLLGPLGIALLDRVEQAFVLGCHLRRVVVGGLQLDHAEDDLRLQAVVGALQATRSGGVDDRAVELQVGLDHVRPRGVGGEPGERGDRGARFGRDGPVLDHQADRLDLERGAQLEDVFDVLLGEDRHLDPAVGLAAQQAFADQDLGRGAEGVAGDAEALGEVVLTQAGARGQLSVEDQVANRVGGCLDGGYRRDAELRWTGDLNGFRHVLDYSTI